MNRDYLVLSGRELYLALLRGIRDPYERIRRLYNFGVRGAGLR